MSERQSKKIRKANPQTEQKAPKDKGTVIFNIVLAAIVVAFVGLGGYAIGSKYIPRYLEQVEAQKQQAEQSKTVKDVMKEKDFAAVEDFKKEYGIADDVEVTEDGAALGYAAAMTAEGYAKYMDMTFEDLKAQYELGDAVTADMKWEDAINYMPSDVAVKEMFGMDFATFKTQLGLPEEITEDTLWSETVAAMEAISAQAAEEAPAEEAPVETPVEGTEEVTEE